jgi:hypothetical protein
MKSLTYAPLPSFRELWSSLTGTALQDELLSTPWAGENEISFWFSRSAWSLRVLAEWRELTDAKDAVTIWLPDYFCNGSLAPLRDFGAHIIFYPITDELHPDMEWCNANAKISRPDIFVLVHYFGKPISLDDVVIFCQENFTLLIEDAAHALFPIKGIGEYGDCVLYSPHKHLAIPDGALLVIRKTGPSNLGNNAKDLQKLNYLIDSFLKKSSKTIFFTTVWLVKRSMQLFGFRRKKPGTVFWPDKDYAGYYFKHKCVSRLSKRILSQTIRNLDEIALQRRSNVEIWRTYLSGNKAFKYSVEPWDLGDTYYLSAFITEDFDNIVSLYNYLSCANLPVFTWPDLPPEVLANPDLHRHSIHLRKSRIFLQVHQTLHLKEYFIKNL